jgi:hypothetical protein
MTTKEGTSYQNPIRFRNSQTNSDNYQKAVKVFESQTPGRYVQDALNVYICTTYKSTKGEPIWNRIDQSNGKPLGGKYILINTGDSGTKPESRTLSGKKISYTIPGVNLRLNAGRTYDKKAFGSFVFILLSSADEVAPTSPTGTVSSTVNATVGSSEYTFITNIVEEQKRVQELYAQMRTDSNGRSGFGATLPRTTPAAIQGAPQGPSINGPGVFVPTSPSPKGPSAPGAPGSGGKGSTTGGSANTPPATPNSPTYSTVVVKLEPDKNIFNGSNSYSGYLEKPYIQQTITVYANKYDENKIEWPTRQRIVRRHVFDIVPNSFEFSQLSSTWNEVERGGNYPLVDWSKYNLTKCSFRFLVASRRIDEIDSQRTTVNDGMDVSIDAEIENIRIMAGSPSPVTFYNFNKLLSTSYRFPYLENTRGIQWVIADLSVTATRLTPNGRGIAAAEVSITLNEYPEIARDIVRLPPLAPDKPVPKQCKTKPCVPVKPKDDLWTPGNTFQKPADAIETPESK